MKKDGMTAQQISRYTGLTAEEIEGLQKVCETKGDRVVFIHNRMY